MTAEVVVADQVSLFRLCDDLGAYTETLAYIEAQQAEPQTEADKEALAAQRVEVQDSIEGIGKMLAGKTDATAAVLRRMDVEYDAQDDEVARVRRKRECTDRARKWLRQYVVKVMQSQQLTQLKTPTNTLFLRNSDAVEVYDAAKVPVKYQNAEVKMPLWLWEDIKIVCQADESVERDIAALRVHAEPSISTIRKAIKAGEDVAGCDLKLNVSLVCR